MPLLLSCAHSHTHRLLESDAFLIVASDGVWEFLDSQEAIDLVAPFHAAGKPASAACTYLIARAALRWREEEGVYRDDISAIVVYLPLAE